MGRTRQRDRDLPPRMRRRRTASGESYYYTLHSDRRTRWIHIGRTYQEAIVRYVELERGGSRGTLVSELIERYERDVLSHQAAATQRMRTYQFRHLRKVFGHFHPDEIKPRMIGEYLDRASRKVAANRNVTALSAVYRKAIRWGLATVNPCEGIELNRETPRDRYMTDAEFLAIKAAAPEMIQCFMDLAYATGARKGDLLALRWDQVSEEGIRIRQGKTGRKQLFERTPALDKILARCKALARVRSTHVICRPDGQPLRVGSLDQKWQRIKRDERVVKQLGEVPHVTMHDIRAKAATDAKERGQDIQALLGHTTPKMAERYVRRRQWEKVRPLDLRSSQKSGS